MKTSQVLAILAGTTFATTTTAAIQAREWVILAGLTATVILLISGLLLLGEDQ